MSWPKRSPLRERYSTRKHPCLTDTEIILLPTDREVYESHLFVEERATVASWSPQTKNRIWLADTLILYYVQQARSADPNCLERYRIAKFGR